VKNAEKELRIVFAFKLKNIKLKLIVNALGEK